MDDVSLSTLHLAGDAYVCCVGGELVNQATPQVQEALDGIQARGGRRVIVDLCGVRLLESAGLGLLLLTSAQLQAAGGELIVVADDPRILRLFDVTGSGDRFRLERTLSEAVTSVAVRASA